jgi:hypothetical protein
VALDDVLGDDQAQARPAPASGAVGLEKALKDAGQVFRRDAHASILDGKEHLAGVGSRGRGNPPSAVTESGAAGRGAAETVIRPPGLLTRPAGCAARERCC